VQDFIKSARRCRDLWYGSRLLSEVSRQVANALVEASGQSIEDVLVFPGRLSSREGEDVSVANKIQLTLPTDDRNEVKRIAEIGRRSLEEHLTQLAQRHFDQVEQQLRGLKCASPGDFHRDLAMQQVQGMMEYFWAAVPFEEGQYGAARSRTEALLAARKNTRNWDRATFEKFGVPKSALDGIRESVIDERVYGDRRRRDRGYPDWARYRAFGIRKSERLCGIGLLKRLGQLQTEEKAGEEVPPFHSTSHMASAPTRAYLDQRGDQEQWQAFVDEMQRYDFVHEHRTRHTARSLTYQATSPWDEADQRTLRYTLPNQGESDNWGYDGVLLYPNRMEATGESSLLQRVQWVDSQERKEVSRSLLKLQRGVLKGKEPFAYYALLQADGDRMGRAIDALGDQQLHKDFSQALDQRFASRCAKLVADHGGSLIYSGGDDVLALLPLHTALQCAQQLRELFSEAMAYAFEGKKDAQGEDIVHPTLSVGLAIAHHLEPFGEVREQARQAEHAAKESGRNRLAVILRKRGNAALRVVGPWTTQGHEPLHERLKTWGKVLNQKDIPSALAYKLEDCVAGLAITPPDHKTERQRLAERTSLTGLCKSLVAGVVIRRGLKNEALETMINDLFDWTLAEVGGDPIEAVQQMARELRIARTFSEAWRLAFPTQAQEANDDN
jgi:CRISPR-associated protein Cmr2